MPADEKSNGKRAFNVVGTRPLRLDGADRVTGRAQFGADIRLPGMLYGAILRSPHAHARIVSIDTSAAEVLPGVKAIVTAADLPQLSDKVQELGEGSINIRYESNNVLARDKVLYHGHAVAGVAATSPHIAAAAAALIKVTYEVLPPVLDVRKAMQPDAPILLPELRTDELGEKGNKPTNIASHLQHKRGDPEAGFRQAAVIVEREFDTATVHQGYIEPQNSTALWRADGTLTLWTSTQSPFGVRSQVSEILELPLGAIRVIPMEIGGGFGGKISAYLDPVAALLSKKSGHKPVKITMSRTEVLQATGPTSASYIRVKMGADKSGHITAATAYLAFAAGAFPGSPVDSAAGAILAPYRLANLQIDGYDVVVNKPRTAAYRAPGSTNAAFASETVVDELSEKLGMDPLAFRLLNGVKESDRRADGPIFPRIGYLETVQAAKDHPHYTAPLEGPYRGRGVASGFWFNYGGKSSASASLNADGTVNLVTGSVDLSGTRTSSAMQFAEALGIGVESIKSQVADTNSVGETEGSYGSRTTFATGIAVYQLGQNLLDAMCKAAAKIWDVAPDKISYANGVFSAGRKKATFKEMAALLDEEGAPVMATSTVKPSGAGPAFAVHIVDIEVDPETGKVDILRYTALQDVGTAIHPSFVEGQIQGGAAQGIGWALNEEYMYDDAGHLLNASLLDYRMPTALDLPMIDAVLVEVPNPAHPYGVRGVGEVPIVPPPAAVANAIYRALGVRMRELPMSPARVLQALWAKERAEQKAGG